MTKTRGMVTAFAVAFAVVLMAGLAQGGIGLLRGGTAARGAVSETERVDRSTAGATSATTVDLKTVSHNICGGSCNNGQTDKLPYITAEIDRYAPHLVMLQEVCWSQYQWFKGHAFTSGTYQFEYTPMMTNYAKCAGTGVDCTVNEDSDPNNNDQRCWVGQVLGARGVLSNRDEIDLGGERYQIAKDANTGATRFMPPRDFTALCYDVALADLPNRVVKGCSTHLRAFQDDRLINQRARTAQAARLASDLDGDIAQGKIVVVGGDFNSYAFPNLTPAMNAFYRPDAAPGGGWGVFYEADHDDTAYWTLPAPDCVVGTDTSCRSGESTIVDESPTITHNTKYDYIFYSETSDPASLSGKPVPLYLRDAGGKILLDAEGKYQMVSDHAFYRGLATVKAS
ncbi:endonuclease/exonuclease/phosphatase family protein [Streptomyces griseosporeus]|uniref:endonuclease/exonuclease/phosphatase family protein n=1 Tax=Streptomyces griseosporeus TaxID=1910 RepID=UPI0037AC5C92